MPESVIISLRDIAVVYNGVRVLDRISLDIKDKEFVTFLGPSGCGKTTTLRIIGGFVDPDEGDVYFEGARINGLPPHKRKVNTIFQRYALFPHLSVYENIEFGLKISKVDVAERRKRVREMLSLVNLDGYDTRSVHQLSGGQQQRVAIARALVNHPRVLLLDEPLGALDLKLRKEMQVELKRIQQSMGITFVYVTHDQEEALTMSDTVTVMREGRILQTGTPQDIYNEPVNAFVADFIGESNIVAGTMLRDRRVEFAGAEFDCVDEGFGQGEGVEVVIRPEDVQITAPEDAPIVGVVESVVFKGVHNEITVGAHGSKWTIHTTHSEDVGQKIGMNVLPNDIHIMRKQEGQH